MGILKENHYENKKTSLWLKFIKRFYGINGELDEYREEEVNRIGNKLFIGLFFFELFFSTIILLINQTIATATFLYINLFVLIFVIPIILLVMLTNRDLQTSLEVPKNKVEQTRQKARKKGWLAGGIFALCMLVFNAFSKWQEGENPLELFTNPLELIAIILGGVIFGAAMGSMAASQIDPEKE